MSTTSLSGDAVLRQVYDPPTESLKTLVTANISGAQEVIINAADDSIKIGDGNGHFVAVNPDGSINVNSSGSGGNASVGATGFIAPTSGTEIAGIDPNGDLKGVSVDINGFLNVSGTSVITGPVTTNQEGLDSFQTSQYTVGTTPVHLAPTPLANRSSISVTIIADPNVAIYIGNSNSLTVSNGYPIYNGGTIQLDLTPSGNIWAVTTVADQTVAVLEIA